MREADQLNKETVMKMIALAAAALIGASFASTSASALPANPSVNSFAPEAQVIQVAEWKGKRSGKRKFWKHRGNKKFFKYRRGHRDRDRNFSFGFGVPFGLGLGYGLSNRYYKNDVDCIGRWHRHYSGRLHCHGQLVYD
jgi:hypothetical protein